MALGQLSLEFSQDSRTENKNKKSIKTVKNTGKSERHFDRSSVILKPNDEAQIFLFLYEYIKRFIS